MYRCYLIRDGRIAIGDNIDADSLAAAIAHGRRLMTDQSRADVFTGLEIWSGDSLVYSDKCHATDTGASAGIESPFQTGEARILPDWRPFQARPIMAKPEEEQKAEQEQPTRLPAPRKAVQRRGWSNPIAA